jgi:glycosyltransferase involved in cell wall biosynthesis
VQAAAKLHARMPEVHFVLCGTDIETNNAELAGWIEQYGNGLNQVSHLLGRRTDMSRIFAALDIATSASLSEAFPMAVGEAMACGTPCVVTDVGDSALIVGETGKIVPAEDPQALAEAWQSLLATNVATRKHLGQAARNRIQQCFDVDTIVERYQKLYREVLALSDPSSAQQSSVAPLVG